MYLPSSGATDINVTRSTPKMIALREAAHNATVRHIDTCEPFSGYHGHRCRRCGCGGCGSLPAQVGR